MKRPDSLEKAIEKYKQLQFTPKNKKNHALWKEVNVSNMPRERLVPAQSKGIDTVPFTVELEIDMWAAFFKFDVEQFYKDASTYFEYLLRTLLYKFTEFDDNTPLTDELPMWFGAVFESSLYGAEPVFKSDQAPWISREHPLKEYDDLHSLQKPDFFKSGLMPLTYRMYGELIDLARDDFTITLPQLFRSPYGLADHLRGTSELLMDLYLNPKFVHELMRFLTDTHKNWYEEKEKYFDVPREQGVLASDEIGSTSISPEMYEEFILPYENELSDFHNGIIYWHSCADTTKLVSNIGKINNLQCFHVGPWTDVSSSRKGMPDGVAFEVCLMPTEDVYFQEKDGMQKKLRQIKHELDGTAYTVRADAFQKVTSLEKDMKKIHLWSETAQEVLFNK